MPPFFFFFWWDDFDEGQHSDFLMFYCRGSEFIVIRLGKNFRRTTPFLFQKILTIIFPTGCAFLNFFFLRNVAWKIVDPGFIPHYNLWEGALSSVLCGMGANVQWLFRSGHFMCFCQHLWHLTSIDLGTVKKFCKRHYTKFDLCLTVHYQCRWII